jgi:hypothetical protein
VEAEHEGRSGAGPKIEDERSASPATAFVIYKITQIYKYKYLQTRRKKCYRDVCNVYAIIKYIFGPQMALAYRLDAISKGPKKFRFPGPNPLPLALVMDAARIKSITLGPYKS